ncbi:peptidase [Arcobacter sp. CECT 8983]|uniref:PepSY-associated TM helix domain-containing protein n=1 Tax=Arcobacter sp. CECT 8983 TaxID=2044508 RepID=UPI00100A4097|nr:PepSY-associated TM helix domain-containing protein [Arcobacter sp. CECT 8983]RXJ90336.1 peptidase [Arcobacter sp. CECT 8983]
MEESKSKLFKQRLFRIHIAAGMTFSIIMYIAIFFGVFAILLPYIKTWEKPSRHIEKVDITKIDYNEMINKALATPNYPKNNLLIKLPGNMGDPAVIISHRFAKPLVFNPLTKEMIKNETKEQSNLADFLNELHYGQPLKLIGRLSFGFVAVGTMVLIITGLILITIMKFKNQGKTQQAVFSKIHVQVFTWAFLPFFLITLSGAVMNVGLISSGPMSKILSKGEANAIDAVVGTVLFPQAKPIKKANIDEKMLPINQLLKKAKEINPQLDLKEVKLINWKDKTAQVEIVGYNPYKPFLNGGIFNKPSLTFSAVTAELIKEKKVLDNVWPVFLSEGIFFLHFLFGIDIFSRIAVAIIMSLCAIAIGFGTMLYLEKKAKKYDGKITFYHWLGKFSLASMIGVIPATATLFVLQWTMPFDLQDRVLWQKGIFYNIWLFTLFWSFYRINSYKAAKEFLYVGGILFILSSIVHFINSGFHPTTLIFNNMDNILGVDIGLILFGALLIYIAKKLPLERQEAKQFWKMKGKK